MATENIETKNGPVTHCRLCKSSSLWQFLDLGFHPPSDRFRTKEEMETPEVYYPLRVLLCEQCGFIQLGYVVAPEELYWENYPYESSTTKMLKEHFFEMARSICRDHTIPKGSLVIDIGSNVGTLLSGFKAEGMNVFGIDPVEKMVLVANANGIDSMTAFFGSSVVPDVLQRKGHATVITGTNVVMHINDLDDCMRAISDLLTPDGMFVFEAPYVVDLLRNFEYDTIYHEHLGYASVKPFIPFFKKFGMELFDVKRVLIHGGSIRVFVGREGARQVSQNVIGLLELEEKEGVYQKQRLSQFAADVRAQKQELMSLLHDLKKQGKRIVCVSAPAKGATLLNYCKIDRDLVDYLTEKAEVKMGLHAPGTHHYVYGDVKLLEDQPDYALILAWNFAPEIIKNLEEYRKRGGKFIIPIPKPRIV